MKKQLAAAASGGRNVTLTLELIYGHITNAQLCCSWSCPTRQICWSAEDVNVLEFFQMSQLNIIDGFQMITVAVLLKLPQLIKQLEQISNNQKPTKRLHHTVWKKCASLLSSATLTSTEYDDRESIILFCADGLPAARCGGVVDGVV